MNWGDPPSLGRNYRPVSVLTIWQPSDRTVDMSYD